MIYIQNYLNDIFMGRKKMYVDRHLKITSSPRFKKAIVNMVNGNFEIAFLEPIGKCKDVSEAWHLRYDWIKKYYGHYTSSSRLPRIETCLLANNAEKNPPFLNCFTSSDKTDPHGRRDCWYSLDDEGNEVPERGSQKRNVHVSIVLTPNEFFRINPWTKLEDYWFERC